MLVYIQVNYPKGASFELFSTPWEQPSCSMTFLLRWHIMFIWTGMHLYQNPSCLQTQQVTLSTGRKKMIWNTNWELRVTMLALNGTTFTSHCLLCPNSIRCNDAKMLLIPNPPLLRIASLWSPKWNDHLVKNSALRSKPVHLSLWTGRV